MVSHVSSYHFGFSSLHNGVPKSESNSPENGVELLQCKLLVLRTQQSLNFSLFTLEAPWVSDISSYPISISSLHYAYPGSEWRLPSISFFVRINHLNLLKSQHFSLINNFLFYCIAFIFMLNLIHSESRYLWKTWCIYIYHLLILLNIISTDFTFNW